MGLHIRLKAGERIIVGGAVLRNGDARGDLWIENEVPVLRECDVLPPGAANTPCGRIYLALQLLYVDPARADAHRATYRELSASVREVAPSLSTLLADVDRDVAEGRPYQALKRARRLLATEQERFSHVL